MSNCGVTNELVQLVGCKGCRWKAKRIGRTKDLPRLNARETMTDAEESNRRINRRIAAASVKHMSNAKWKKLFSALHSLPKNLGGVAIKFINDDRLFSGPIPGPEFDHDDNIGECGGISYQPFAHIEFVQIQEKFRMSPDGPRYPGTQEQNDIGSLIDLLAQRGGFPIQRYENGIKIVGYEWTTDDKASESV